MNFILTFITLLSVLQIVLCQEPQERSFFGKWKESRTPDALLTSAGVVPIVKIPSSEIKTLPEFAPFYATPIQSSITSSTITAEQIEAISNLADLLPEQPTTREISQYAQLIPSSSIEPLDVALRTSAIKDKSKANKLLNILKHIKELKLKPFKFIANKIKGTGNIPSVGLSPIQSYFPSAYSYPQYPSNSAPLQFNTPELHSFQSPVLEYAPPKTFSSEKVYVSNTDSFLPSYNPSSAPTSYNPSIAPASYNPPSYSANYPTLTNDFQVSQYDAQPPNVHYPYYPLNINESINPRIISYLSAPSSSELLTGSASEDIESIVPKPSSSNSNHKLEQNLSDSKLSQFSIGNYTQNLKIENENYNPLAGRRTGLKPFVVNEQQNKETKVSTDATGTKSEE